MAHLFLVRHGKSTYNEKGLWCGWTDVDLVDEGYAEARRAAEALRNHEIHEAHTSELRRTHQTLGEILNTLGIENMPIKRSSSLNERHYGIHTGKNKWQVKEEIGEEEFQRIRRGWDVEIPEGETLKTVHDRVAPYYQEHIRPAMTQGKNVLIVSHGNTLRALMKHLENMTEEEVGNAEIETGQVHGYEFDEEGNLIGKKVYTE